MKRLIAILLTLVMLVSMNACKAKTELTSEPPSSPENTTPSPDVNSPEIEEETASATFPEEMVGTWILVDSNDTELTEELYPGVKENGGTMEISSDGLLFWTVGSSSGTGRIIEVCGDEVSAELSRDNSEDTVPVSGLLENSTEAFALYMSFFGVDLIWVHVPPKTQS